MVSAALLLPWLAAAFLFELMLSLELAVGACVGLCVCVCACMCACLYFWVYIRYNCEQALLVDAALAQTRCSCMPEQRAFPHHWECWPLLWAFKSA